MSLGGEEPILDEVSSRVERRADQFFWEYWQWINSPGSVGEDLVEEVTGIAYEEYIFEQMRDLAERSIVEDSSVLELPKLKSFASYFGAVPHKEDGQETTRSYIDRLKNINIHLDLGISSKITP